MSCHIMKTLKNLNQMGRESDEWGDLIQRMIIDPVFSKVIFGKLSVYLDYHEYVGNGRAFWSTILTKILHHQEKSMVSRKTMDVFMEHMGSLPKGSEYTMMLYKDTLCTTINHCLFIYPSAITWNVERILYRVDEVPESHRLELEKNDPIDGEFTYLVATDGELVVNPDKRIRKLFSAPAKLLSGMPLVGPKKIREAKQLVKVVIKSV